MPKAWTAKDERQYEHVKDSERAEGRSGARAKQIAAATVNKQRSKEGRAKTTGASARGTSPRGKSGRGTSARGKK